MKIQTKTCPRCGSPPIELEVPDDAGMRYLQGATVTQAFPNPILDANQREMLLSGLHGQCWDETMGTIDDELSGDDK
jgi:hypothetical protein